MSEHLELALLGKMHIVRNGRPVGGFVSSKSQALLCYLAITGREHSREELAGLLWGDMGEAEARANLRGVLHNLRQLVGPYLRINRQSVAFQQQPSVWLDVAYVQAALHSVESVSDEPGLALIREAVDLYGGDLMQGFYVRDAQTFEEWLLAERERLRQLVVQALYILAAHYMTLGEHGEAIRYTTRLLEMDPWREEVHRQLMLLLALSGQRSAALRQYEVCRQILMNDLHVEPVEETTALYRRILDDSWVTAESSRAGPANPRGTPQQVSPPFVGRRAEYAWLFRQWEAAQCNDGLLTLVQGEAGVGKTQLVEELLHHVGGLGALTLRGTCRQFERDLPYQPVVEILRSVLRSQHAVFDALSSHALVELARLLPELYEIYPSLPASPALGDETSRQRLFVAIAQLLQALLDDRPSVVLFLDDLHFADPLTVDLLRYLLYHLHGSLLWCVGAYRPEETDLDHPLLPLLYDLGQMQRVALLQLQSFGPQVTAQLTDRMFGLDREQQQQLADYLDREAEGNAFIICELLRNLEQRGVLRSIGGRWRLDSQRLLSEEAPLPDSVQSMVLGRLSRLPAMARAVLAVAACIGRSFDPRLLMLSTSQHDQDVGESIEILLARQLLREILPPEEAPLLLEYGLLAHEPPDGVHYTFAHNMIRRVIYAGLSYGNRKRLLARIAVAARQLQHAAPATAPWKRHVDHIRGAAGSAADRDAAVSLRIGKAPSGSAV